MVTSVSFLYKVILILEHSWKQALISVSQEALTFRGGSTEKGRLFTCMILLIHSMSSVGSSPNKFQAWYWGWKMLMTKNVDVFLSLRNMQSYPGPGWKANARGRYSFLMLSIAYLLVNGFIRSCLENKLLLEEEKRSGAWQEPEGKSWISVRR